MDNKITKRRLSDFLAYEWILMIIIAVIALLCAAGLIIDGAVGYGRYRKSLVKPVEKEKETTDEVSKDAPTEQIIIPVVDEPTDSAIVN